MTITIPGIRAAIMSALITLAGNGAGLPAASFLSDIPEQMLHEQQGWGVLGMDTCVHAPDKSPMPMRIGGTTCAKGLGAHAPSEIIYHLGGRYSRFTCLAGAAEGGGSVVFQVFGDDRKLFDSGTLHGLSEVHRLDLPVDGVQKLRLIVTDAGDGYIHDMANWANPRLLRGQ